MKIGVANSISFQVGFDSIDTLKFICSNSKFQVIQVYLNQNHLKNYYFKQFYEYYINNANKISIIYHLDYSMEEMILHKPDEYLDAVTNYGQSIIPLAWVSHINMQQGMEKYEKIIHEFKARGFHPVALEWVFEGHIPFYESISKFSNFIQQEYSTMNIIPVLDIPRFYHSKLGLSLDESTHVVRELIRKFNDRSVPIIYHLIDILSEKQERKDFCSLGSGLIPWHELLPEIKKSHPDSIVIFEHENKTQALESLLYLETEL